MLIFSILSEGAKMSVKIKVISSRPTRVPVVIRRPAWREFLNY